MTKVSGYDFMKFDAHGRHFGPCNLKVVAQRSGELEQKGNKLIPNEKQG